MGKLTHTHTFAELEVSTATYDEIAGKLREADYGHAFMDGGAVDMHGIGLVRATPSEPVVEPQRVYVCTLCQAVPVDAEAGFDTCPFCIAKQ